MIHYVDSLEDWREVSEGRYAVRHGIEGLRQKSATSVWSSHNPKAAMAAVEADGSTSDVQREPLL